MYHLKGSRHAKKTPAVRITALVLMFAVTLTSALSVLPRIGFPVTAEEAPAQTYTIHTAQEFTEYSRAYAAGNRNKNDVINVVINEGSVVTTDGFVSIGTSENPFSGTINVPSAGVDIFHLFDCPLFNYVSTDFNITGAGTVKIMRERVSETPDDGVLTSGSLFANHVTAGTNPANWSISLLAYDGEGNESSAYAGLIGDIAAGANVTVVFTNTSAIPVSGSAATGLICGDLGAGATLAVTTAGSGAALSVTSTGGHAGGIVGNMGTGSTLKFNSANLSRVTAVTSSAGYAGGIVGNAENITVEYAAGITDYTVSGSVSGTTGAGGLFGRYLNTDAAETFDMLNTFAVTSGMAVTATDYAGGVFGMLENNGASFVFDGNSGSESITVSLAGGKYRGGVCGGYKTNALSNTFEIFDVASNFTATLGSSGTYSAGLIGAITSSPAYVNIHNVTCAASGTPNAGLVGTCGTGGSFVNVTGGITVSGTLTAGLVADIQQGVLRLSGVFDLGSFVQYDGASGYLVKERGRALVYAVGNGAGTVGNWTFKRNDSATVDDIHSWGEVIRMDGVKLSEGDLLTVNMTAHTVTVAAAQPTMTTLTDFAKTALNIKLNTGAGVGALQFTSGSANLSDTLLSGTLTLSGNIALTGTGITGLARDNGGNSDFSGTFEGNNHTITFATGENYGLKANGTALDSDSRQGNIFQHAYNGLFAETSGATVQNLILAGEFKTQQSTDNMKLGGVTAFAKNALTLNNVTTAFSVRINPTADKNGFFGGAIGIAAGSGANVSIVNSNIGLNLTDVSALASSQTIYVGGAIGFLNASDSAAYPTSTNYTSTQTVNFTSSDLSLTYNKTGSANRASVFGAAIAGVTNCIYGKDNRRITFTDVDVDITATGAKALNRRLGAILGTDWYSADVTINDIRIDSSITATGNAGDFGGLVRTATGRWDVQKVTLNTANFTLPSASGSTFGFIANKATVKDSSGANGALYLDVNNTGTNYDIAALSFTGNSPTFTVFDEIVADSRFPDNDITNNGNAIISITTSGNLINTNGSYNTYLNKTAYGQLAAAKINPNTRYYYNMNYARANTATAKYNFFVWSVKTYAHSSLAAWFTSSNTFSGDLDMTGISYYPVDLTSGVTFNNATVKLDNVLMENNVKYAYTGEAGTRTTRSNTNQHYLMHTAIFRNDPGSNITVTGSGAGLTLQGNVPKLSDNFCGFLVAGMLGNSDTKNAKMTASKIVFDGAHIVTDTGADLTTNAYAPLLINKVGKNFSLTINAAQQSTTAYSAYGSAGKYAASSLIGDVGSSTARAIYLTFENLKFDGRSSANSIGNMDTAYGTSRSIFSRATILNSFLYAGESSGSYIYEIEDDWGTGTAVHNVTYGKEVTTSVEFAGKQDKYYGSTYYTHPTAYQSGSAYDFSTGFLPHVYTAYNLAEHKHELAVNVMFDSEIEGCGKYDDPFIIDDDDKLPIISRIINKQNVGNTVVIHLPSDITNYNHTDTGYTKNTYNFGIDNFTSSDGGTSRSNDIVRRYLAGAYYVITKDITLPGDYVGLGTTDNDDNKQYAFRGVIIGRNITITNQSPDPLIHTSMGSVVKNITIDVDVDRGGSNVIDLDSPTGSTAYSFIGGLKSYGAVIGQILGGDNIIDNTDVTFTDAVFNISTTNYDRLTPVGGYVGTLFSGGLIFRNMTSSNTGLTAATFDKISDAGYIYVNPIIGRVINGYAFHETGTYAVTSASIPNGNKNYTIPDLSLSAGKLGVSGTGAFTITVPDGQAMYILGAIVNSGAGSAAYNETTEQAYQALSGFWQAYRAHTTTRAGSGYSTVGSSSGDDYTTATGDTYSNGLTKIPYIVSAYTNKTGDVYIARCISTATGNTVKITGDCNVAAGFRGIGCIYLDNSNVRLSVKKCGGYNGNSSYSRRVTLNMRFIEYDHLTVKNCSALAGTAGYGLFNVLVMNGASSSNSINNLTMSGSVYYDVLQVANGNQSAYKFKNSTDGVLFENVLSVGGIIGYAKATAYYLKSITVDGLQVEGARYTGGLIGFTGDTNTSTCTLDSCGTGSSTAGLCVKSGVAAGGLIGYVLGVVAVNNTAAGTQVPILIDRIEVKCTSTTDSITSQTNDLNSKESLKWLVGTWVYGAGGVVGLIQPRTINKTSVTNCTLIGKSGNAKHVFSTSTDYAQLTHAGGMFGITKNRNITFTNANIENMNIESSYSGGIVGSGFADKADDSVDKLKCIFEGVTIDGNKNAGSNSSITGYIAAGGFIGNMQQAGSGGGEFTANSSTIKNYNICSASATNTGNQTAGGFLGYSAPNNSNSLTVKITNFNVEDCAISNLATGNTNTNGTGGLFGAVYRTYIKGYNIHITGTSVTATAPYQRTATIIGNNRNTDTHMSYVRLVGVSAQLTGDTTATTKSRNVGGPATGSSFSERYGKYTVSGTQYDGYIIFADYSGTQTNTAFAGIDDSSVSTDNYTDVASAYPYVTANPTMAISGATLTGDGVGASVPTLPIQSILSDTASGRYAYAASNYYTGSSGDTNFAAFNSYTGKLAMFRSEVPTYLGTDFPVLILDDTTRDNSQKMINSYLRLLTNTRYNFADDTTDVYTVKIYNMEYDEHFSAKATGASLKRSDSKFYMLNSQFDSGKTQFSLIDVRFLDPNDNTKVAYHLYVPIFVKKVLSYRFDIAQLSGTSYLESLYASRYGQALIENTGMPVTLSFKYTYSRTASEWASAINAGENVNRNYAKSLLFYKANTNELLMPFPSDTILTLVDQNDGDKPYYASAADAMSGNTLNLSAFKETMTADGAGGYTFSGNTFTPQPLDKLMTLTATADPEGTLVTCDAAEATVMVGTQGYRAATDEELAGNGTKYTVSVSDVSTERYFLTIYTESNAVNDELFHYFLITTPTSFSDASHPSKITDTGAHTMVHLVMGKIFHHTAISVTSSSANGTPLMSASNNLLTVDLTAQFGLSDDLDNDIRPDIQSLISATTVYQSFLVYLNRKENLGLRKEILGSPSAAGSYCVDYTLNGSADDATTAYSGGGIRVTQNYAEFVTGNLSSYFASGNHFEIDSSITLTYSASAIPTQFPGRTDLPPSDNNGVTVSGASNIAFQQEATTYSKNTIGADEIPAQSYYSESAPEVATLDLNPVGDKVGDFTPLGINALNNNDSTVADFDLLASLNTGTIADGITGYTEALVTVQLTQKLPDGSYGAPLDISDYMTIDFEGLTGVSSDATSYYRVISRSALTDNPASVDVPVIHCHVLTGSAFEAAGFTYGNYKITVTVALRTDGTKISISQASNFVVYTNAKIIPRYLVS